MEKFELIFEEDWYISYEDLCFYRLQQGLITFSEFFELIK
tara:strand:+ start:13609 stop:13728 length:120 start_codon:yes stop_codon:yes gene_type:complete